MKISIHLMLRFNFTGSDNNSGAYDISIHLMLRFNLDYGGGLWAGMDFNTSYVTVQLLL